MKSSRLATTTAAICLAALPIGSHAASQPTPVREDTRMQASEQLGGSGFIIPLLAIAAVILGILAATSSDGDRPVSP